MTSISTGYSFVAAADIVGVTESKLRYWSQVGFVGPSTKKSGKQAFTFQDLVSVRAAKELVERGFSAADIRKALDAVRASLPDVDRPLDRMRVAFDGRVLIVIDDGAAFEVTGQRVFDFGLGELAARASAIDLLGGNPNRTAYEWFSEGLRLERETEGAHETEAGACYRRALGIDVGLAAAHTNLGALAHRQGDLGAARASFEAALACDPDQSEARYNLAHILIEQGEIELAAAELRRVVQTAPHFADAHFNLATALEQLGSKRQAREHLERYVALSEKSGGESWIDEARARIAKL